jgi:hypothetical protein
MPDRLEEVSDPPEDKREETSGLMGTVFMEQ